MSTFIFEGNRVHIIDLPEFNGGIEFGKMQKQQQKPAEIQRKELRSICEHVRFYTEFHVDSELRVETSAATRDFNTAFANSKNGWGFCRLLEKRLDNEMLRSEQFTLKVLQISLCLLSLMFCPFMSGTYGERGICLALSGFALLLIIGLLLVKLLTLNRWLTQQHWFIMEAFFYGTFCLLFCLCSLIIALLNVHRHFIQQIISENDQQQTLAYIQSLVLALCAATFAIDIGCVYSQRLSRTWIPSVSKYRI